MRSGLHWRVALAVLVGLYLTLVCQGHIQGALHTPPHLILFEGDGYAGVTPAAGSPTQATTDVIASGIPPSPPVAAAPRALPHPMCSLAPIAPLPLPCSLGTALARSGTMLPADNLPSHPFWVSPLLTGKPQTTTTPDHLPPRVLA